MLRSFLLFISLFFSVALWCQSPHLVAAMKNIESKASQWELQESDYKDMLISSSITTDKGITYLYLNQSHENIPLRNAMMTVIIKEGAVVSDFHNLEKNVKERINATSAQIDVPHAILSSAKHLGVEVRQKPTLASRSNEGKMMYALPELSKSDIPVELKYEIVGEKIVLVWNININMKDNADYWDINIDAVTGEFVSKDNLTIYCQHHDEAFANHDNCSIRTFRKISDNTQPVSKALNSGNNAATYNVYKLPVESPRHGDRSLATDDLYPDTSPFGWHATGMDGNTKYTITRGNNVYAFEDKDDNDQSDGDEPDGGAELVFDFPMDLNQDPRESNHAAVTNLFYMVNMMHDITYKLGFDEAFGNFQQTNYSGVGQGNDYVLAQAFDGITQHETSPDPENPKINNANFATPPDGFNGRMQMYFWNNNGGAVSIDSPESISGFVEFGAAQFGGVIPNANENPIAGKVIIARGTGSSPTELCNSASNAAEISGNIALIDRGGCQFSQKVFLAQQAGAIAVIICNIAGVDGGDGDQIIGMAGGLNAESVNIPSAFFRKSDCDKIRFEIFAGNEVTITFKERGRVGARYFDGSLDNGIIAHEFGHGISNRLTGGPAASGCLTNDEQMGEGWSDYYSLITSHREGDTGSNRRGIGTFAVGQAIEGRGIRRFPYSTDFTINPQTMDDIKGTTAPHPLGEIWAASLWDMYWAFVDKYGYDEDWNNTESGNYRANYLVMEGMKMQACRPGFIQGRDAIFKADSIHYNGENSCMLWELFARRGLGFFADGGSSLDRNDGTEDFEPFPLCIEKLKIFKTADVSVDPGETIDIEIKAVNHIPSTQNGVVVTDDLPDGMVYVAGSANIEPKIQGNLLVFELGDMNYQEEITISFKTQSSPDNKSVTLESDNFDDGNNEWEIESETGNEFWYITDFVFNSPDASYTIENLATEMDATLITIPFDIQGQNPAMKFSHRYNTEIGVDGGFVEISVNNGPYELLSSEQFIRNAYNQPLAYGTLARVGINVFSGNSTGNWDEFDSRDPWIDSYIDLSDYKGQNVKIRFRFVANESEAPGDVIKGWFIDDFEILDLYKYVSKACISANGGDSECTEAIETLVNSQIESSTEEDNGFFITKILPNPAGDYFVLAASAPLATEAKINVTRVDGRLVMTSDFSLGQEVRYKSFDISGWNSGVYFVTLVQGEHVSTIKLIKN